MAVYLVTMFALCTLGFPSPAPAYRGDALGLRLVPSSSLQRSTDRRLEGRQKDWKIKVPALSGRGCLIRAPVLGNSTNESASQGDKCYHTLALATVPCRKTPKIVSDLGDRRQLACEIMCRDALLYWRACSSTFDRRGGSRRTSLLFPPTCIRRRFTTPPQHFTITPAETARDPMWRRRRGLGITIAK